MAKPPEIPTADPALARASHVYRAFMEEIKTRLIFIQNVVDGLRADSNREHGFLDAEAAILQLRNVCELMALSGLAAHQPFGLTEELMDSWNARLAFRELSTLNPHCFPRPIKSVELKTTGIKHLDNSPEGFLSLRGLMKCYLRCGKLLHRGVIRHAFDGTQKLYDIDWIDDWAVRIGELLVEHTVMVLDHGVVLIVHLYGGPDAQVSVQIALGQGPAVLVEPNKGSPTPHPTDG